MSMVDLLSLDEAQGLTVEMLRAYVEQNQLGIQVRDDLGAELDTLSLLTGKSIQVLLREVNPRWALQSIWPEPLPIEEAPKDGTEIQGWEPNIGWRVLMWHQRAWRLCGAEESTYAPTHFLPLPPKPKVKRPDFGDKSDP